MKISASYGRNQGLDHTNAFLIVFVFVSTKTKEDTFGHTSVSVLFSPVQSDPFSYQNAYFLIRFRLSTSTLKRPKTLMETTVYDAFYGTVYKSLRFHLSALETERFQKALLNSFRKPPFFISVFGRFSADDSRKRIKKCTFLYETH